MIKAFGFIGSDQSVFLLSDSRGFSRFGFQISVFIGLSRQQYKDAKPLTLILSYSTGEVNPSIFGIKSPLSVILGLKLIVPGQRILSGYS
jgi:hypothetical protein